MKLIIPQFKPVPQQDMLLSLDHLLMILVPVLVTPDSKKQHNPPNLSHLMSDINMQRDRGG